MAENQLHSAFELGVGLSLDWTSLPGDVRDMIFGTQSLKTLGTLRLVCKSWRAAASNLRCSYSGSENLSGQKLQAICKMIPKCSLLILRQSTKLTSADLVCTSDLRDLRDLHLPCNSTVDHVTTLCSFQNVVNSLRTLYVTPPGNYFGTSSAQPSEVIPTDMVVALSSLQNLRTLHIRRAPLDETLQAASRLRHLTSLGMTEMISREDTSPIASFLSNLSELRIFSMFGSQVALTRADTDTLFKLPRLEILRVGQHMGPAQTQLGVVSPPSPEAARLATSLVELDMPYSFGTDEVLATLDNLKLLTRISVIGGSWPHRNVVSCDALRALAHASPRLMQVSLSTPPCSDDLIEAMSHFRRLRRMNVSSARGPLAPAAVPPVTDEGFQYLSRFQALHYLSLQSIVSLTTASAEVIGRLSSLTDLSIYHTSFTSEAMKHLSSLRRLVNLTIDTVPVNDEALEAIVRSNPRIVRLSAARTNIAAAHYLSCLTSLQSLDLTHTVSIDDSTIAALASLPLHSINIQGTSVTGVGFAGAKYVTSLSSLTFVASGPGPPGFAVVRPVAITAEGAQFVAQFKNVRSLYLSQPLSDSVFYELMSRANYTTFSSIGLSAEQVPSLLLCTSIRALALTDTKDIKDEMLQMICSSLPNLQSFQVRYQNQTKVLKQTPGAPTITPLYPFPMGPPPFGPPPGRGRAVLLHPPPPPKPPAGHPPPSPPPPPGPGS